MQHTLYTVLQGTSFFLPHHQQFFQVCVFWNHQSAWRVLFRPPSLAMEGHQNLTHINSGLLISRTFLPHAGSSCTLLCLYLVSCTQTMRWRAHSLADTVPPFLTILQFSSESNLPCLCPLWIYCTGQQHKASLFPCFFSCLSSFCLQLLCHGSYLSFAQVLSFHTCTITSPFLRNTAFPF